jgi:DNA-binding transcriptional LysR family regulator
MQHSVSWKSTLDRLDELSVFVTIIDAGSLAAAGRRLRRSPPAVSRALAGLEERLGTRLVERTTRQLALTEAGRLLAERARALLVGFDEAMRIGAEQGSSLRGSLLVSAPLVFGRMHVMPLVSSFLDAHPAVRAELILSDRYLDLVEEGLDVALRIGQLGDSGLVARRVGQVRRVVVAAPSYLAERGAPGDPAELSSHSIIFTSGRATPMEWRFRDRGRERSVRLAPRLIVNQVDAALSAARDGRGVASALSYQVAADIATSRLVRLLQEFERPPLPVQLVVASTRHMPARVLAFLDHAVAGLTKLEVLRAE